MLEVEGQPRTAAGVLVAREQGLDDDQGEDDTDNPAPEGSGGYCGARQNIKNEAGECRIEVSSGEVFDRRSPRPPEEISEAKEGGAEGEPAQSGTIAGGKQGENASHTDRGVSRERVGEAGAANVALNKNNGTGEESCDQGIQRAHLLRKVTELKTKNVSREGRQISQGSLGKDYLRNSVFPVNDRYAGRHGQHGNRSSESSENPKNLLASQRGSRHRARHNLNPGTKL
jgi:hypothetical protein